jgi:hypothetical protein
VTELATPLNNDVGGCCDVQHELEFLPPQSITDRAYGVEGNFESAPGNSQLGNLYSTA